MDKISTKDDKVFHEIMEADAAAFDDAAAIAAFTPTVSSGEDVVVLFNGVAECIKSNYGVATVVFGAKDRPDVDVKKVSVNIINDATLPANPSGK